MKYVIMSVLCLQIMFSAHAMSNGHTQKQMQDLYCDFFSAEPYERDAFDTRDWGQPQWDATNKVYLYKTGITVQYFSENNRVKTRVKFPHYDPIVLSWKWEDRRFADVISVFVKMDHEFKDATDAQSWADSVHQLCNLFNAYAQHGWLEHYDTRAWGNRHWNFDFNYWEYDCGVTVEIKEADQITVVTFPGYDPIRVKSIWYDPRFKETDAPSVPSYNRNLIKLLHEQYARDHIIDDATWGHTKRYNDDLTAYTYVETGIQVDTRSGVVTFPGYQNSLSLPKHMAPWSASTVDTTPKTGWLHKLRSTLATMCVAALMWCLHPES